MLKIVINSFEGWDPVREEFVYEEGGELFLEHSLLSVSEWESKWKKPFLSNLPKDEKTTEEVIDYVRCMLINKDKEKLIKRLTRQDEISIRDYINDSRTATVFSEGKNKSSSRRVITSEIIYYWMTASGIPFECEKWHINRLLALIRVCGIENSPKQRMKDKDILKQNAALNRARRAKHHTKG